MSDRDYTPPVDSVPIPFAPGYRISPDGTVWSSRKKGNRGGVAPWRIMKTTKPDGRRRVQVPLQVNGKNLMPFVHRLVLEAFVGPCPLGMEGCHNDGNPSNNHVSNLRWDTPKNNSDDKKRHGTHRFGETVNGSLLKDADIPEIFRLAKAGWSQSRIAKEFRVSRPTISAVLRRTRWAHILI